MSKKKKREAWGLGNGFEDWGGYMAAKKMKLEEQFQEEAANEFVNSSNLFQGISIFVNGYTNPAADELKRLMMEYGGMYHYYMRPQSTTHIIASNLPYSKIMLHKKSRSPIPICKPEWITDSIKAGRILDYQKYLLYSNYTKTQPQLRFGTKELGNSTKAAEPSTSVRMTDESFAATGNSPILGKHSVLKDSGISKESKKDPTNVKQHFKSPGDNISSSKTDLLTKEQTEKLSDAHKATKSSSSKNVASKSSAVPGNSPILRRKDSGIFNESKNDTTNVKQHFKSPGDNIPSSKTDLLTKEQTEKLSDAHKTTKSSSSKNVASKFSTVSGNSPILGRKDSGIFNESKKDPTNVKQHFKSPGENISSSKTDLLTKQQTEKLSDAHKATESSSSKNVASKSSAVPGNSPILGRKDSGIFNESKKDPTNVKESSKPQETMSMSKTALSTNNPDFLSEFYNNSRLHHISTMGTMFKDYINELRDKSDGIFPGLERLKRISGRPLSDSDDETLDDQDADSRETEKKTVIMHIDMDCFFVSVGLKNRPELRGLPVAVTHAKGNRKGQSSNSKDSEMSTDWDENCSMSEIASCSYEARKAGVKNGMFLGQALKLCPNLKMIKYNFEGYNQVSYALYDTVASYTLNIEAVSCDEMYTDCTLLLAETHLTPMQFAEVIRKEIKEKTGCPVSTGFGENKLQARLATRRAKPDGQFYLRSDNVQKYLGCFIVRDLPGVGYTTMRKLNGMGVHTCAELQSVSIATLQREFGKKTGEMLYNISRGIDNSKLSLEHVRKSVSAEVNYGIRFKNSADAEEFLKKLSVEVCNRLNRANMRGRCVTLKLMVRAKDAPQETTKFMGHGICDHITRSKNLISSVNDLSIISKEVLALWNQLQQAPVDIRGVGIQMSRLESTKSKSEKNNLMSFINKAKLRGTEQKSTEIADSSTIEIIKKNDEKTSKTSNAKGLNAFLVPKNKNEKPTSTPLSNNNSNNKNDRIENEIISASTSKTDQHVPNHNHNLREEIDEDILAELPEDIRNEFLSTKNNSSEAIKITEEKINYPLKCDIVSDMTTIDKCQSTSTSGQNGPSTISGIAANCISTDDTKSEDIDESVLAELPEDIRNEIISTRNAKEKSSIGSNKESVRRIQTKQESYFREAKSKTEKLKKIKMPAVNEIDMSVLIELPEEIRNEILNEYRAERRGTRENVVDEINVSFSQVDPDFLAALPDEVKNDVQDYCIKKKLEKESRAKNEIEQTLPSSSRAVITSNKLPLNQKTTRQTKTRNTIRKNAKTVQSHKKSVVECSKVEVSSENKRQNINTDRFHGQEELSILVHPETRGNKIIHENKTIIEPVTDKHEEMLNRLVEQFLSLPIRQMKLQLQTWISESDSVNEVDFLSLATFLSTLPRKKRIEDLHVLLKTMHRCINKTGNCAWHRMYRKTVEHVQRHMQVEYESNLMLPPFECELPQCRNTLTR